MSHDRNGHQVSSSGNLSSNISDNMVSYTLSLSLYLAPSLNKCNVSNNSFPIVELLSAHNKLNESLCYSYHSIELDLSHCYQN